MNAPAVITVLIVDDDPFVRRGVSQIFGPVSDIEVVADVDDGDQVIPAITRFRPHVVLMDLKMRRVGGLEATRLVQALPNPPKVVAMTAMDVDDLVMKAIEAGAHSFISKLEAPETFHMSVRAVAAGNTLFSEDSLRQIVAGTMIAPPSPAISMLSPREREVLCILASGSTNADIASNLFVSETTVKTHISGIFSKLGATNRVEAALCAFRAGLVT